ncbi:uncharacterized protein B0P05DRAFT_529230 [Gilbertella persicaria]|uniref:uncharacterized protein n=1 Tax=Gilbertella persicaria TaxID=101096 RepID=UPI00221ED164|nr:uncharacterized protein B0P05DRAFT_529230 [Gilbertella persicaria]KAI8090074.1 hypothetical protein B0P05DRAFT_529230 [Gilbertella persicaria]
MNFYDNKKRPSAEEIASDGLPRKRFISEESFAKDMAAMTLDSTNNNNNNNNNNVIRINNIDQFLAEDEFMQTDTVQTGLPLQWKPGDKKPHIPDFVLNQSE